MNSNPDKEFKNTLSEAFIMLAGTTDTSRLMLIVMCDAMTFESQQQLDRWILSYISMYGHHIITLYQ